MIVLVYSILSVSNKAGRISLLYVEFYLIEAVDKNPYAAGKVELRSIPDMYAYDVLIFGALVQGFSLSSVMKAYLSQIPLVRREKDWLFCYTIFSCQWMGGSRTSEDYQYS